MLLAKVVIEKQLLNCGSGFQPRTMLLLEKTYRGWKPLPQKKQLAKKVLTSIALV
jgi:hypothetical protein